MVFGLIIFFFLYKNFLKVIKTYNFFILQLIEDLKAAQQKDIKVEDDTSEKSKDEL